MAYIETINESFKTECAKTKEIHEKISEEHINSILYFKDVQNNKNLFDNLDRKINDISNQLKNVARNCQLKGSDAIKGRASVLSIYSTNIINTSFRINSIISTITNKSKLVYDEKKLEYDTNYKEIKQYIDDYDEKYKGYEDANNKKTDYIYAYKKYRNAPGEDIQKYIRQKDYYEKQRVYYLTACEHDAEKIKELNEFNNELLEKFLKKVDESIQL